MQQNPKLIPRGSQSSIAQEILKQFSNTILFKIPKKITSVTKLEQARLINYKDIVDLSPNMCIPKKNTKSRRSKGQTLPNSFVAIIPEKENFNFEKKQSSESKFTKHQINSDNFIYSKEQYVAYEKSYISLLKKL
ncbi:hypothetical protein ABPG74_006584 [Tetrahymena malaccensis]